MFPAITIPKLHAEYDTWMRELTFYKEEIKIFERHLEDVINKHKAGEVAIQVEHFQKQFMREIEVIDELKHKINGSERQLASFVKELSGLGLESIKMDNHPNLGEDMKTFRQIFTGLKHDFRRFERLYN